MADNMRFCNPHLYTAAKNRRLTQTILSYFQFPALKTRNPLQSAGFIVTLGWSGESGSAPRWYNLSTRKILLIPPDTLLEEALRIIQREFDPGRNAP